MWTEYPLSFARISRTSQPRTIRRILHVLPAGQERVGRFLIRRDSLLRHAFISTAIDLSFDD